MILINGFWSKAGNFKLTINPTDKTDSICSPRELQVYQKSDKTGF